MKNNLLTIKVTIRIYEEAVKDPDLHGNKKTHNHTKVAVPNWQEKTEIGEYRELLL